MLRSPLCSFGELPPTRRWFGHAWNEIAYVYGKMIFWLYCRHNAARARRYAPRLSQLLAAEPNRMALVGKLSRAVLAELEGELGRAVGCRERVRATIETYFAKHPSMSPTVRSAMSELYTQQHLYGPLAELLVAKGRPDKALEMLREVRTFCRRYRIRFEGQTLIRKLETEARNNANTARPLKPTVPAQRRAERGKMGRSGRPTI